MGKSDRDRLFAASNNAFLSAEPALITAHPWLAS
jgi:hypothetical protein